MCEGGLGAVARTKFVRRSDGRREVSHQSELTSECYLRQARMMEHPPKDMQHHGGGGVWALIYLMTVTTLINRNM